MKAQAEGSQVGKSSESSSLPKTYLWGSWVLLAVDPQCHGPLPKVKMINVINCDLSFPGDDNPAWSVDR